MAKRSEKERLQHLDCTMHFRFCARIFSRCTESVTGPGISSLVGKCDWDAVPELWC